MEKKKYYFILLPDGREEIGLGGRQEYERSRRISKLINEEWRCHMPRIFLALVILLLYLIALAYIARKSKIRAGNKGIQLVLFIISLLCLIISIKLFQNLAIYADESGTSPVVVCGGWFWLIMNWVRLLLLFALTSFLGVKLLTEKKTSN